MVRWLWRSNLSEFASYLPVWTMGIVLLTCHDFVSASFRIQKLSLGFSNTENVMKDLNIGQIRGNAFVQMCNHSISMSFNSLNLEASTRQLLAVDSDALMCLWLSFLALSGGKCEHLLLCVPCTGYCGREKEAENWSYSWTLIWLITCCFFLWNINEKVVSFTESNMQRINVKRS